VTTVAEVLDALNDPSRKVGDVLRLCLQLARDTTSLEFLQWARRELAGYEESDDLPTYRVAELDSRGTATNGAYRYTDIDVSGLPLKGQLREWADTPLKVFYGVGEIDDLLVESGKGDGHLGMEWPLAAVELLNYEVQQGRLPVHLSYRFESVAKRVPRGRLVDILEQARTRVALELAPLAQDAPSAASASTRQASPIGISVAGSNNQLIVQSPGSTQWQLTLEPGDVDGLMSALGDEGVREGAQDELRQLLSEDVATETRLMRALEWAKAQALSLPTATATAALSTLILRHFGLA
jgi:hypothetical protein